MATPAARASPPLVEHPPASRAEVVADLSAEAAYLLGALLFLSGIALSIGGDASPGVQTASFILWLTGSAFFGAGAFVRAVLLWLAPAGLGVLAPTRRWLAPLAVSAAVLGSCAFIVGDALALAGQESRGNTDGRSGENIAAAVVWIVGSCFFLAAVAFRLVEDLSLLALALALPPAARARAWGGTLIALLWLAGVLAFLAGSGLFLGDGAAGTASRFSLAGNVFWAVGSVLIAAGSAIRLVFDALTARVEEYHNLAIHRDALEGT